MWRVLTRKRDLSIKFTLTCGQQFGWKRIILPNKDETYVGVINKDVVQVKEEGDDVVWRCIIPEVTSSINTTNNANIVLTDEQIQRISNNMHDYFHLEANYDELYDLWKAGCPRMKSILEVFQDQKVRVVRQDPVECLFCFIISSNNNVARITQIVDRLRQTYGDYLGIVENEKIYSFPTLEKLANANEEELRGLGLGYRANFIHESAKKVLELGGTEYLYSLRNKSRKEVQESLLQLKGVGMKVADCVALFSMDKHDAIPVDTHVWTISVRDYDRSLEISKSLTPKIYDRVGDLFRTRFGSCAGWAHTQLFSAELTSFQSILPVHIRDEMIQFRNEQRVVTKKKQEEKKNNKNNKKKDSNNSSSSNDNNKNDDEVIEDVDENENMNDGGVVDCTTTVVTATTTNSIKKEVIALADVETETETEDETPSTKRKIQVKEEKQKKSKKSSTKNMQ